MAKWHQAMIWKGSNNQQCGAGDGRILRGQWSKWYDGNSREGGNKVYHDDCAEAIGAYGFVLGVYEQDDDDDDDNDYEWEEVL